MQSDFTYQASILQGVSRTFALTIPQLPSPLASVVGNAYLLCRIADTIEDDPALDFEAKRRFSELFVEAVGGRETPEAFAAALHPRLSASTLEAERDLVANTPRVLRLTHGFSEPQRAALERCVRIMSRGMAEFAQNASLRGLDDVAHLDRYCYHVAGVVGEMLTELFCDHDPIIDAQRHELRRLAVSFGQGLQMTNILKDVWEDHARGACWLPRDVFERAGCDLTTIRPGTDDPAFRSGFVELIGLARAHLANALAYTLAVPAEEPGIRRFCLWALGMAVLTLRELHRKPAFSCGDEVKISRRQVRATVFVTSAAVRSDAVLKALFAFFTRTLPVPEVRPAALPAGH